MLNLAFANNNRHTDQNNKEHDHDGWNQPKPVGILWILSGPGILRQKLQFCRDGNNRNGAVNFADSSKYAGL